jgi:hypothetical protein
LANQLCFRYNIFILFIYLLCLFQKYAETGTKASSGPVPEHEGADESSGVQLAWSTGLAEVALPISYKLKNIEATERAAGKKSSGGGSNSNSYGGGRYGQADMDAGVAASVAASATAPVVVPFSSEKGSSSNFRFQAYDNTARTHFHTSVPGPNDPPAPGAAATTAGGNGSGFNNGKGNNALKRSQLSSDDRALENYKKVICCSSSFHFGIPCV